MLGVSYSYTASVEHSSCMYVQTVTALSFCDSNGATVATAALPHRVASYPGRLRIISRDRKVPSHAISSKGLSMRLFTDTLNYG